jgi:hypothetical protein
MAGSTDDTDKALRTLLEKVAPGSITISRPRFAVRERSNEVELSVRTREVTSSFTSQTVREAVDDALECLTDEEDPYMPPWRGLTRMQRDVVVNTLRELSSKHMAAGAEAKIARDERRAFVNFELADAFSAAADELYVEEVDAESNLLPKEEKLEAKPFTTGGRRAKTP